MEFNAGEIILLLLATIGPLKVTIVAASLMSDSAPDFVNQIAKQSVLTAMAICLVFAIIGEVILGVFKVSFPAFELAGGLIVLLFSIQMVAGAKSEGAGDKNQQTQSTPSPEIAVSPLAIPLMASVSGLVAIVSILAQNHTLITVLYLSAVIVVIMGLNYLCLRYSGYIVRAIGPSVFQVVGRLMGLILAALAIELMLDGFHGLGLISIPTAAPL